MKRGKALASDLADRLELPDEALSGAAKLTVTGGRRALIENHRGLLEYGTEHMVVNTDRGPLNLHGQELRVLAMNARELLIGGKLQMIEWSEG